MQKNNKPTVTIAIPSYNEEANIAFLLTSLLKQQQNSFFLKSICVLCDGCTDKTATIAKEFAKSYSIISIIDDNKRLGKSERLNQAFLQNTSDILVTLDGDILLKDTTVLCKVVDELRKPHVVAVSANARPIPATTFIEGMINTLEGIWYDVRKDYRKGVNMHNIQGALLALRKDFIHTLQFPKGTVTNSQYIYFLTKEKGKQIVFAKNAHVYFRSPSTLHDYLLVLNRYTNESAKYRKLFGRWVDDEYSIPTKRKIHAVLKHMFLHPFFTILGISFLIVYTNTRFLHHSSVNKKGIWEITASTKRGYQG